jgi:DNA-binding MarR family transcriptional regulator
MSTDAPAPPGSVGRRAEVSALSEQLPRFLRMVHAIKNSVAADARDRAPLVLLFPLARLGPLRQGSLAELVHADPSTVSRHVAELVGQGLVERVADASDGRASRLVLTDAGHTALDVLRREREGLIDRATTAWSVDDLATLTRLFERLVDDLATTLPTPDAPREQR